MAIEVRLVCVKVGYGEPDEYEAQFYSTEGDRYSTRCVVEPSGEIRLLTEEEE